MNKQKKICLRFAVNKQTRYSWDPTTNSEVRREGEKYLKTALVEECRSYVSRCFYDIPSAKNLKIYCVAK